LPALRLTTPINRNHPLMSKLTEPLISSAAVAIARRIDGARVTANDSSTWELAVNKLKPSKPRTGWYYLAVSVQKGEPSRTPLMEGIISGGGRGVRPWLECRLFPTVEIGDEETLDARGLGLESALVGLIGELIPDGGHMMVDYETPGQAQTHAELLLHVPPSATYLGALMFRAGFRGEFKDWYFSEGGHEGPRKLQANKSPNREAAAFAMRNHVAAWHQFVRRPLPTRGEDAAVVAPAIERARALLREFARPAPRSGTKTARGIARRNR
jgi:hypothetical protein